MLESLNLCSGFVLYAACDVKYNGRANSILEFGNYLIIRKIDGSVLIHAADKIVSRNYMASGAKLKIEGNQLFCKRKTETIIITIDKIIYYSALPEWSTSKLMLTKTESQLRDKLIVNWSSYFTGEFDFYKEYQTEVGPIDLVAISNSIYYIIELKRNTAVISGCSQLHRYVNYFIDLGYVTMGYIASPKISKNALKYLENHNYKWLSIDF